MDKTEQMTFFYQLFDSSLPRLGPGEDHLTYKALQVLLENGTHTGDSLQDSRLNVLDIGCGTGAQTLELARHIHGTILAVDNHQPFLDELQRRAKAKGLAGKIQTRCADMATLDLKKNTFDLIWSEGALYNMGFRKGLTMCHSLLKPGGTMAVSELCWLTPNPPEPCRNFFSEEYPAMMGVDANRETIENCGYFIIEDFIFPESAWLEPYYDPLKARLTRFQKRYAGDRERMALLDAVATEIALYHQYSPYYGYVFYLIQRRDV